MAWQSYVDNNLMEYGLTAAAIFGRDGAVWAQSVNFPQVSVEQIEKLEDSRELAENGLFLGGLKYRFLRSDSDLIYGKKGTGGTCVRLTKMAFIIGLYDEPCECNTAVANLGDYLCSTGY